MAGFVDSYRMLLGWWSGTPAIKVIKATCEELTQPYGSNEILAYAYADGESVDQPYGSDEVIYGGGANAAVCN